jgi:shikimate dehydrogenase
MHNAAITALGLDAVYVALRAHGDAFEPLLRGLLAAGAGLNVTVPHKRRAAGLLDAPSDQVRRTGACNTVWSGPGGITGDNTDVAAVREVSAALVGDRVVRRALVIGTGGSARAAAVAVADGWPGVVVEVLSRDAARAQDFLSWAEGAGLAAVPSNGDPVDLVINATPLGLTPADVLPLDREHLRRRAPAAVMDLVYVRGHTRFVQAAREAGIAAQDGRNVLLEQGAASFRHFFGVRPPRAVMRAAVEDSLGA